MPFSRRELLKSLSRSTLVLSLENVLGLPRPLWAQSAPAAPRPIEPLKPGSPLGVGFVDVGRAAGLNAKTIYGGEHKNKYLLETTGCGVAFYDYDNDGWLDIFLVNGTRLEGFPVGQEPVSHLFKNNRDGTFTDVTLKAGLARSVLLFGLPGKELLPLSSTFARQQLSPGPRRQPMLLLFM